MDQRSDQHPAVRIEPRRSHGFPLRKHPAAGSDPWSIHERSCEIVEPLWVDCYIVIGKGQHLSLCCSNRAVQCVRLSWPRLKHIAKAAGMAANETLNHRVCAVAGVVIGNQDLPCNAGGDLGGSDTLQRRLQKTASIEGAHNDCDIHLDRFFVAPGLRNESNFPND